MARYSTRPPLGTPLNPAHPLNRGLVGYWPMAERAGGNTMDLSGNGNHGTLTNIVQGPTSGWTGGNFGGAMSFDGVNDRIDCGPMPAANGLSAVSASAWVYRIGNGSGSWNIIVNKRFTPGDPYNIWALGFDSSTANPVIQVSTGGLGSQTGITAASPIPLLTWQHVAGVYDGSTIKIYVNGLLSASTGKTGNLNSSLINVSIGSTSGTNFLWGALSEVRIHNRALSASEVQQLSTDPFCMYEQKSLSRWFVPGGAVSRAGSFFFGR